MNIITISGRLATDVEQKMTTDGKTVCSFSVAVQDTKDKAFFFPVEAWGKTAEFIATYFIKGKGIEITGKLINGTYTDSNNLKRSFHKIQAQQVGFAIVDKSPENNGDLPF